ncbi:hypothetical protein JOE21_001449 [Desmospora profundinema]|uniref:Uncharacterized protein n=1 Tax=Desmospora profundinema TaxID=1571184 RepID=A0ABU1IKZ3_9BACL|nr:hypothetical protein [Desmospora profundinema]
MRGLDTFSLMTKILGWLKQGGVVFRRATCHALERRRKTTPTVPS